jgi:uncharacterized protein
VINFLVLVACVYAALIGALYAFQRQLLYHPGGQLPTPRAAGVSEMEAVTLRTEDGLDLVSWYAAARGDRPTVVYFHGNAGNIGDRASKARRFLDAGFGLLLVSYRGYGGNPGRPTEQGLYADGRAALDFLLAGGTAAGRVVLFGESLGSGVAVHLAAEQGRRQPVAAVVLETPYSSIVEVAGAHYPFAPVRILAKDRFEAATKIAGVGAPVLMFHAEDDRTIPIRFARRLFAAARQPKEAEWFAEGGHEGLFDAGADRVVLDFIRRHAGSASTKS